MEIEQITATCELCDRSFAFGHGHYDGKVIAKYNLTVCKSCYDGNWDGWGPSSERRFVEHLERKNCSDFKSSVSPSLRNRKSPNIFSDILL